MKIKRLYIKEYQQFKDVEFIFNDHKNCIIGQSGTGKTTLLNLIYSFSSILSLEAGLIQGFPFDQVEITFYSKAQEYKYEYGKIFHKNEEYLDLKTHFGIRPGYIKNAFHSKLDYNHEKLLFITCDLQFQEPFLEQEINKNKPLLQVVSEEEQHYKPNSEIENKNIRHKNILLSKIYNASLYDFLLRDILSFDRELLKRLSSINVNDFNELIAWRDNKNPRIKIAHDCLNSILKGFYLEVDTGNTDYYIAIKHSSGERISPIKLSTGTRQIILSSLPIYLLRENLSLVLFDEPERSLFPDIQKLLPDHYTSLAPDAQFFFVTHSPFFAAGFNEDERINLYFNDAGYVTQDTVTKGFSPRGDDANDMLYNDFKVSSMNEYGLKMHKRYLELNNEADYQLAQGLTVDKKLLKEIRELGDKYNF